MSITQTTRACQSLADDTGSNRWDEARRDADLTSWLYRGHTDSRVRRWGERIAGCGHSLTYEWKRREDGTWGRRLRAARLCRVRTCPICMWRRSLRLQTEIEGRLSVLREKRPELRPVMLTLTVRNCELQDLRETVREMLRGWSRLTRRVSFSGVKGWLRSVEVTPGKRGPGFAHPHIHALLLVDETWEMAHFERNLWVSEWGAVCRLDYAPIIDVRPVTNEGGVIEVLKYCVKTADYANDKDWLPSVALSLDRLRVFASGGLIRVTEPELKDDEEQGQTVEAPPYVPGVKKIRFCVNIIYIWNRKRRKYLSCTYIVDHPALCDPPLP